MSRASRGQKRGNGRVFVLGIRTGHDHFIAPKLKRELAAGIRASACRMDLGSVICPFEVTVATLNDRHGGSPDRNTRRSKKNFLTASMSGCFGVVQVVGREGLSLRVSVAGQLGEAVREVGRPDAVSVCGVIGGRGNV